MRDALVSITVCLAALAALPAQAQRMYKCVDASGKTYYTQVPPPECLGKTTQELSKQGRVVKETQVLTPQARAAQEAERKKKAEEERHAAETRRKDTALLNTYSSEKDIEDARARSIRQVEESMQSAELTIAEAKKRLARLEKEKEFYAKTKIPPKLQQDMDNANLEIRNQGSVIEAKKKEIGTLNTRYDEDRKRYLELTRTTAKK